MKDRLLQEEIAMARLNPSSENTLNEYLHSVIDGQVLLELPLHGEGVNLQANVGISGGSAPGAEGARGRF